MSRLLLAVPFVAVVVAYLTHPVLTLTVVAAVCVAGVVWAWDRTTIGHRLAWQQAHARGLRVSRLDRVRVRFTGRPVAVLDDGAGDGEPRVAEQAFTPRTVPLHKVREHRVRASRPVRTAGGAR